MLSMCETCLALSHLCVHGDARDNAKMHCKRRSCCVCVCVCRLGVSGQRFGGGGSGPRLEKKKGGGAGGVWAKIEKVLAKIAKSGQRAARSDFLLVSHLNSHIVKE